MTLAQKARARRTLNLDSIWKSFPESYRKVVVRGPGKGNHNRRRMILLDDGTGWVAMQDLTPDQVAELLKFVRPRGRPRKAEFVQSPGNLNISKVKPWEAYDMGRATWYARLKAQSLARKERR